MHTHLLNMPVCSLVLALWNALCVPANLFAHARVGTRPGGGALFTAYLYCVRHLILKLKTDQRAMSYSAPYTSESPLQVRHYHTRVARVGSLTPAIPETSDMPDSPPAYDQTSKRRLTICVVGSGGVGKSSLTVRYLNNHFPEVS